MRSLLFEDHLRRYQEIFNKEDGMARQEAIGMHEVVVLEALSEFQGNVVTLSERVKNKETSYYLRFGLGRRFNMIRQSLHSVRSILPTDSTEPLRHNEIQILNKDINLIYLNTRGVLDNYSWCLLYELAPEMALEFNVKNKMQVNILSKKTILKVIDSESVRQIMEHKKWIAEIQDRRDPVAHRIPLAVHPNRPTDLEELQKYNDLVKAYNEGMSELDYDKVDNSLKEMDKIGECDPSFSHHPAEPRMPIYPTIPNDIGHLIVLGKIVIKILSESAA